VGRFAHLLQATRRSRLIELLCCVLSIVASCDSSFVLQVLEGPPCNLSAQAGLWEQDPKDDDEMLRPHRSSESQSGTRKREPGRARPDLDLAPLRQVPAALRLGPSPHPTLPGGEHARRNGIGTPLRC
jgi:hypothetical protein